MNPDINPVNSIISDLRNDIELTEVEGLQVIFNKKSSTYPVELVEVVNTEAPSSDLTD